MSELKKLTCAGFVVKVCGICNLGCKYCYMFKMGDNSFKSKPTFMSTEVMDNLIMRAKEHCIDNNLNFFQFILHGGEPRASAFKK